MSRLQQHQKKQFIAKIAVLSIGLLLLLYFIFTIGFRMLLNMSVFIANLGQKNTLPQITKTTDSYGSVSVDSIPSATNSAHIIVSGSVVNYDALDFYINGENVKEMNLNSADTFSQEIGELKIGENEVFVKAKMKDNPTVKQTTIYTVIYKSADPKLEIKNPSDKAKVSQQEITINGMTDKETFIKVNDLPVVVDAEGNFQTSVKLKEGDNQIIIVAQDIAGNTVTKTMTVTYQKDN